VKNTERETLPLASIERSSLLLLTAIAVSGVTVGWALILLMRVDPLGFMVMIPGVIFSFQTLWLLLNPFAKIYADRIEIRQSFLHGRTRYFVDIKKIQKAKDGKIYITYNDDEVEHVHLFGIRKTQKDLLKDEFRKHIVASVNTRT
jgi:hypothetical protein